VKNKEHIKMKLTTLIAIASITLTGCSSISRTTSFDGRDGKSFALVASDDMPTDWINNYDFVFQEIDVKTSKTLPYAFSVIFSATGPMEGNEFKKPQNLNTTVRFGGAPTHAGDYVLIARIDNRVLAGVDSTVVNCYAKGAAVFRIHGASINIISVGSIDGTSIDEAHLKAQVQTLLSDYPKFSAAVSSAEIIGKVVFQTGKNRLGGKNCSMLDGNFVFSPKN